MFLLVAPFLTDLDHKQPELTWTVWSTLDIGKVKKQRH